MEKIQLPHPGFHPCPDCGEPINDAWIRCWTCHGSLTSYSTDFCSVCGKRADDIHWHPTLRGIFCSLECVAVFDRRELQMAKLYAGIGRRSTPHDKLLLLTKLSQLLATKGYTLRTGGAVGADLACLRGQLAGGGSSELYLPWPKYNNDLIRPLLDEAHDRDIRITVHAEPSYAAIQIARSTHPNWEACSNGAKKLHGRNTHIIYGPNISLDHYDDDHSVDFVLCWHDGQGGTMQAVRLVSKRDNNIPVYNVAQTQDIQKLLEMLKKGT